MTQHQLRVLRAQSTSRMLVVLAKGKDGEMGMWCLDRLRPLGARHRHETVKSITWAWARVCHAVTDMHHIEAVQSPTLL